MIYILPYFCYDGVVKLVNFGTRKKYFIKQLFELAIDVYNYYVLMYIIYIQNLFP